MTLSAPIPTRHDYAGNDVTENFSYSNKIDDKGHLELVHTDASGAENLLGALVVDVDYTVNDVGVEGGGSVDFPKAGSIYSTLATGEKLAILYVLPIEQTTDVPNLGRVFNESIEGQLDYMTMVINQLQEQLDRTITLVKGSSLAEIEFPEGASAANRASKLAAWDATGLFLELVAIGGVANVDPIASKGDIVQGNASGDAAKLAIGGTGSLLNVASGLLEYLTVGSNNQVLSIFSGDGKASWNELFKKGGDIASATTLAIDNDGNAFDVTGTTAITAFSGMSIGQMVLLRFDGAATLTHHATNLVLPGGKDIVTVAGDAFLFFCYDTDDVVLVSQSNTAVPSGIMSIYAGDTAPAGWLMCNGTTGLDSVTDTTLAGLFAVIGTVYGGTGAADFALPDMRGNFPLGADNMDDGGGGTSRDRVTDTEADTVSDEAGSQTHVLDETEMPIHSHTYSAVASAPNNLGASGSYFGDDTSRSTSTSGSDAAHQNMPPYMALNYIIKK